MFNALRKSLDNLRSLGPAIGADKENENEISMDSIYWSLGEEDKKMLRRALGRTL
jgi:hypothetical protein